MRSAKRYSPSPNHWHTCFPLVPVPVMGSDGFGGPYYCRWVWLESAERRLLGRVWQYRTIDIPAQPPAGQEPQHD